MSFWRDWIREPEVDPRNVVLTGVPRSGTTLVCTLLDRLPDTVALHEPIDPRPLIRCRLDRRRLRRIASFYRRMRHTIRSRGTAVSKHVNGRIPDNPVHPELGPDGKRPLQGERGRIRIDRPFSERGVLVIKQPLMFTALLPRLRSRYRCYAVIRNPLAVLGSWSSVPMSLRDGRAPVAEKLSRPLRERLDGQPELRGRQLALLSWFFERFSELPRDHVLRYEEITATGGRCLESMVPAARGLEVELECRNHRNVYDPEELAGLGRRLLDSDGGYWKFYSRESVQELLP